MMQIMDACREHLVRSLGLEGKRIISLIEVDITTSFGFQAVLQAQFLSDKRRAAQNCSQELKILWSPTQSRAGKSAKVINVAIQNRSQTRLYLFRYNRNLERSTSTSQPGT